VALRRTTAHVASHWREQIAFPVTPRAVIPPKGTPYAGKPIDQAAPDSIHSVAAIRTLVPGGIHLLLCAIGSDHVALAPHVTSARDGLENFPECLVAAFERLEDVWIEVRGHGAPVAHRDDLDSRLVGERYLVGTH
jgi:hypothetical protein